MKKQNYAKKEITQDKREITETLPKDKRGDNLNVDVDAESISISTRHPQAFADAFCPIFSPECTAIYNFPTVLTVVALTSSKAEIANTYNSIRFFMEQALDNIIAKRREE